MMATLQTNDFTTRGRFDDLAKAQADAQKICATGFNDVVSSLINQFEKADIHQVRALIFQLQIGDTPGVNRCFDNVVVAGCSSNVYGV
jgi:hypothetical protein